MSQCSQSLVKHDFYGVHVYLRSNRISLGGILRKYTPVEQKRHKKQENDQWRLLSNWKFNLLDEDSPSMNLCFLSLQLALFQMKNSARSE